MFLRHIANITAEFFAGVSKDCRAARLFVSAGERRA
jgi:hypothetical protein